MSLDKLAGKIAKRDERAFGTLYEELRRLVFAVCLGVVKNRSVAEEITQDTFVTVWQKSGEFRGVGYKTWILTIARNKAINHLKKQRRETPVDFVENEWIGGSAQPDMDMGVALKMALECLDATDRQIVLMRNAGMKAKEVADVLKMPRGTVSWRYGEALKILQEKLGG